VSALSPQAQRALLDHARATLLAHFDGGGAPAAAHEDLQHPGSAFVTLRRRSDRELRGCIGLMDGEDALAVVVAKAAIAAATRDGRFDAVRAEELPELHIEISVLGPVSAIGSDEVEVGRHGLVVQLGSRRGLLLPQVPVDRGWDRETFLSWTCRKAGLPPDTWRRPDCELLGFTALVFGEDEHEGVKGDPTSAES
jgi:AmmeMemoRadiSam system protein A